MVRVGRRTVPAWTLYLLGYTVALVPYLAMAEGPVQGVYFQVLAWSGVGLMVVRLLRERPAGAGPLWLLTAWEALTAVGVLVLLALAIPPSPGPQDVLFLLGNFAGIAGTVWMVRRRIPGHNRESLLDAAIVSCGFALLFSVFLIKPAVAAAGSLPGAIVGAAYPVMDLFVLALLVRLLLGGGLRSGAMRLIGFAQLAFLVADSALGFLPASLFENPLVLNASTAGELLVYGIFGAAALHPDFTKITVRSVNAQRDLPWLRTPLLWTAVMAGPALLIFEAWQYHLKVPDAAVIASACIVVFGLVVARLQALLTRVNSQSAVLTEQAERLRVLASHDGLTGLLNRRAWDTVLAEGLESGRKQDAATTVAIIDLDHFKRYNDTFGHQAGDRLLKSAAAVWTGQLRQMDLMARYGGEEFIVLLPGCDSSTADRVLRRLREVTPEGQTFSAGIATWDTREPAEGLVARADSALYQAKNGGRNRSIIASPDSGNERMAVGSST